MTSVYSGRGGHCRFDKPRGYFLDGSIYNPEARAAQWGENFGKSPSTGDTTGHTEPPLPPEHSDY